MCEPVCVPARAQQQRALSCWSLAGTEVGSRAPDSCDAGSKCCCSCWSSAAMMKIKMMKMKEVMMKMMMMVLLVSRWFPSRILLI